MTAKQRQTEKLPANVGHIIMIFSHFISTTNMSAFCAQIDITVPYLQNLDEISFNILAVIQFDHNAMNVEIWKNY